MARLAASGVHSLLLGLAVLCGCGPRIVTTRAAAAPRTSSPPFRAVLTGAHGVELACEATEHDLCRLVVEGVPAGVHHLRIERAGDVAEGDLGLRGAEQWLEVAWSSDARVSVVRVQRAPPGLVLSLPSPGAATEGPLPALELRNGTPVSLRGTATGQRFLGELWRRDDWNRWAPVGSGFACASVEPGAPLPPGATIDVHTELDVGDRIVPRGHYRFDLVVDLADPEAWDREADSLGWAPLMPDRDGTALMELDLIELSLELEGSEILAAPGAAEPPAGAPR